MIQGIRFGLRDVVPIDIGSELFSRAIAVLEEKRLRLIQKTSDEERERLLQEMGWTPDIERYVAQMKIVDAHVHFM